MEDTSSPQPDDGLPREQSALVIAVTRTGGLAGLTKVWTAEPREDEAPVWVDLIDRCPWDAPIDGDPRGADRFVWNIHATCGPAEDRRADLPDRAVTGPWRELVDAVRDWSDGSAGAARAAT